MSSIFRTRTNNKVAVLGGGSWGSALALVASEKNFVKVWDINQKVVNDVTSNMENSRYLPGIKFPHDVEFSSDLKYVLYDKPDIIIFALPSHVTRMAAEQARKHLRRRAVILSCSKGLEEGTNLRMTQILHKCLPITYPVIPLIGPTHAEEVAKKIPSAIVAGSKKKKYTSFIQEALTTPTFRIYTNTDTVGVEYASTLKNIIAIAAGMADGVGFGDNTKAALITRGLAEMVRFGKKMGANERTFYGLAGVGDLITTCNSPYGRNLKLGKLIAGGLSLDEALNKIGQVCEGIRATSVVYKLSEKKKIDMPIVSETYKVLFENKNPLDATKSLMERKVKDETWGHA